MTYMSTARRRAIAAPALIRDCVRAGRLWKYVVFSRTTPGFIRGEEAVALTRAGYALADGAIIVEIGSFLGASAVLLAGARKRRGSGELHCVDAFDASGDAFSVPIYQAIQGAARRSLRRRFDEVSPFSPASFGNQRPARPGNLRARCRTGGRRAGRACR